jgi:SpoVK/Ycf46/Vps4 family AAA+-type ATPase
VEPSGETDQANIKSNVGNTSKSAPSSTNAAGTPTTGDAAKEEGLDAFEADSTADSRPAVSLNLPSVFGSATQHSAAIAKEFKKLRKANKNAGGSRQKGVTASMASKGFASFLEIGGYTPEEVDALQLLREHAHELISSLCTDPRQANLANFPSISASEQSQIEHSIQTLIDAQIDRKLESEAFAHLTSSPMSSLMAKGRTAMFNQIGFSLKAPANHEGYVFNAVQRLASKFNAKVIDFDFNLLRSSEYWFTDSVLQSGSSEDGTSNLLQLFQEVLRDDEDFTIFMEVLFEVIQKQTIINTVTASLATPASTSAPLSSSSSSTQNPIENASSNPSTSTKASGAAPSKSPSFVVLLRGIDRIRSFPYRAFKESLRSCRANVLFLELETSNATSALPSSGIINLSPGFMIAPNSALVGDEDEAEGPVSLRNVIESIAPPKKRRPAAPTHTFLHGDPIDMTNRAIIEAEKRKAEDTRNSSDGPGGPGLAGLMGGFLARVQAETPNFPSAAPKPPSSSSASTASIMAASDAATVALATLERRHNLQENLKQLAACIRASHLILIPNSTSSSSLASTPSDPSVAASSTASQATTLATSSKPLIRFAAPPELAQEHMHPSIPQWSPEMTCITDYWLNPDLKKTAPESFELTCLLLATQSQVITSTHRIIRQAIKLQDMHQFRATGTWNHFSPSSGMLVRIGAIEAALQAGAYDATAAFPEKVLIGAMEAEVQNEPTMKLPLEIRFLHEAINIELGITEKLGKAVNQKSGLLDAELQNSDEVLLPLAKRAYSLVSQHFRAPKMIKEGQVDPQKTFDEQKEREAEDEEILQERLRGMKLNSNEKSMLQNYVAPSRLETSFDDIGSLDHAKEELMSLIVPMSIPVFHKENKLIKTPLGILLYGPPGTGKTMLARALAKTANASFIHISASTIMSKWLGDSEGHAAAVFSLARKISPCIVFIDEVDGLLHSRDTNEHETSRRVKNEFFSGWDGLLSNSSDPNMSVTVIAATNRPFDLDNAALRRLPHRVLVNLPDQKARVEILRKTLNGVFLAPTTEAGQNIKPEEVSEEQRLNIIQELATITDGYSGSDLKSVCTRAAQQHVRDFMSSRDAQSLFQRHSRFSRKTDGMEGDEGLTSEELHAKYAPLNPDTEAAIEFAKRPVTMKEFNIALSEISASVNSKSGMAIELKKWHETYGSKPPGFRPGFRKTSLGF